MAPVARQFHRCWIAQHGTRSGHLLESLRPALIELAAWAASAIEAEREPGKFSGWRAFAF
jgi:hypothetical protein